MAFHPNHYPEASSDGFFTPTVFSAAVLSTLAIAPSQELGLSFPYNWMPVLPETPEVMGLAYRNSGSMESADNQYTNAAYLTSVVRVRPTNLDATPPRWTVNPNRAGPGLQKCTNNKGNERRRGQNVPPPDFDVSLDVIFLYPMRIPLVNRIFFGAFVNFSSLAQDMSLDEIGGDAGSEYERTDVMKYPTRAVLPHEAFEVSDKVDAMLRYKQFRYPVTARNAGLGNTLFNDSRRWYPIPIRARCTLQVEGSIYPLVYFNGYGG